MQRACGASPQGRLPRRAHPPRCPRRAARAACSCCGSPCGWGLEGGGSGAGVGRARARAHASFRQTGTEHGEQGNAGNALTRHQAAGAAAGVEVELEAVVDAGARGAVHLLRVHAVCARGPGRGRGAGERTAQRATRAYMTPQRYHTSPCSSVLLQLTRHAWQAVGDQACGRIIRGGGWDGLARTKKFANEQQGGRPEPRAWAPSAS